MKQSVRAQLQRYWDVRATGNFAFGGTGGGLILASTVAYMLGERPTLTLVIGLCLIGVGLFCVWLEIGKPWRSINVFFHARTSWMTREALVVPPLFVAGGAAIFLDPRFIFLAAVLAAVFVYCQARILHASRGIPAWCQNETVPLILATALAEGTGLFVVIGAATTPMIGLALAAAIGREFAREIYRRALVRDKAPAGTLRWFSLPEEKALTAARFAAIAALAGALFGWPTATLGGLLAVATGWGLKYMLVNRAAFTRGHVIRHTPARGHDAAHVVTVD